MTHTAGKPSSTDSNYHSIGAWVEQAAKRLEAKGLHFGHGTANAFDEACWMVSHALDLAPDFPDAVFQQSLDDASRGILDALCQARIESRKPLAYLIGQAWFAGLMFEVTQAALVPRSPMAEIILGNAEPWFDFGRAKKVLDIGTGSGAIAAAVAHHWPMIEVDAVDVSPDALALAQRNVNRLGLASRVRLHLSDLYDGLGGERFDVILANPPYVPESSMETLPPEYRHEPSLGLVAGHDGLSIVHRLIREAPTHLAPGGVLICEVGEAAEAFDAWALEQRLEIVWLDFEHGGDGVFLVTEPVLAGRFGVPK